jgi:hypothetical protein
MKKLRVSEKNPQHKIIMRKTKMLESIIKLALIIFLFETK